MSRRAMPPLAIILSSFILFIGIGVRHVPWFDFGPAKVFFAIVMFVVVASGFIGQAVRWWCLKKDDSAEKVGVSPKPNDQAGTA